MGLSDYVRAEFLRNRSLEFVKAARAMGLSNAQIIWRHVLPNSHDAGDHVPAVPHERGDPGADLARLPRPRRAAAVPSLGDLLRAGQGQPRRLVDLVPTFVVLVLTLLLLTFIGDALRDAFDTRKS